MENKKIAFFWAVTPYSLEEVRRFGGTHGRRVSHAGNEQESGCQQNFENGDDIFLRNVSYFRTARRHKPEEHVLHNIAVRI
jgi:hypothetical protein